MKEKDLKRIQKALEKIIEEVGSTKSLAQALHLHLQNIYEWRSYRNLNGRYNKRIPLKHIDLLIKLGNGRVTHADLRPDVFKPERKTHEA